MKKQLKYILDKRGYYNTDLEKELLDVINPSRHNLCTVTYLIYIIIYEGLVLIGSGYVVFGLNRSVWWMLLGSFLSAAAYTPKAWRKLFKN